MTQIGTVIDGKYEILKEIGRGGMSVVYLAMDKRLNKQWAVKEIRKRGSGKNDEIVVNSLLAEANLMKRLDHPALPRIVDIIDNGQTIYVIMDYIEGESLDKILNEYGAQPEEQVIAWAMQVCDALGYLHNQKPRPIIYRDMKPANLMLKPEGNIKIIDFGIAREYKEQNLADTTVLGTKGYAPPEQYSGQTDPRSDIFALGMTMYHLLTGVDPRGGEPYAPVRQWNPNLSDGIEAIIDKCVQPAPENRYQSCAELLYDLEHPDLVTKGYKKKQKRKLRLFVIAAGLSLLMLAAGFVLKSVSTGINNSDYENLIGTSSTAEDDTLLRNYTAAIRIYPTDPRAYIKLLDLYKDRGKIGTEFQYYYEQNKNKFDANDPTVAEMHFKAGMLYFNYYAESFNANDGSNPTKALPFFEANHANSVEYENKELCECFYQICSFYKSYMLSNTSGEGTSFNDEMPGKDDFENLIQQFNTAMDQIAPLTGSNYLYQMRLYHTAFCLLYDQKEEMHSNGVSLSSVLNLLDRIENDVDALPQSIGNRANDLREEIQNNYLVYREQIQLEFGESGEGGDGNG